MIRSSALVLAGLAAMETSAAADDAWRDKAVELAVAEPKIHEALWSQDISFWVSVDDDGTRRDGYAEYVCLLLNQAGRPDGEFVIVTVWDRASMAAGSGKQLGKAPCM